MKINIPSLYKRYIRIIPGVRSYLFATFFVLALGLGVTAFSWYVDRQRIEDQQATRVVEQGAAVRSDIVNSLSIYEQILRGGSGLFKASDSITRAEWKRFVEQYDLANSYPGISGLGYVQNVPASSLGGYTDSIRNEGFPDFNVLPQVDRTEYAPITFIEPFMGSNTKALGFDILSDTKRRLAAEKARDSGEVAVSDKLVLTGDSNTQPPGFVMYMATYKSDSLPKTVEGRLANHQGYVFAGYSAENFFGSAIDESSFNAYSGIEVFDGRSTDKSALLYQSKDFNSHNSNKLSQPFTIKSFDRNWTYRFADPIPAAEGDVQRSNMILIGGTTLSCAIAGFLFLVMLTRARAIVYSKQKEAQQAKDDLLSLASHQLRTPATAVKQYLGMILEGYTGKVSKKLLPALQKAYSSNERQLDTINQILYVAKADAGRLSINRNNFDINYLVDDIALDLGDVLEESGQSLVVERTTKKLKVFADEASLRMVVENLISNGSKYSHKGATITVKTGIKGDEIYVAVVDQGVGIARDDFNKLFKKFSRIDNDLSLQVGGSGIGLYIDKVLIELHGGRIQVESIIGKGSTFAIYLPKNSANNLTDRGEKDGSL